MSLSRTKVFSKTVLVGALTLACTALYNAPASAVSRSFHQNAGAICYSNTSSSVDVLQASQWGERLLLVGGKEFPQSAGIIPVPVARVTLRHPGAVSKLTSPSLDHMETVS